MMSYKPRLYITDEQYEQCLDKIRERVEDPDFKPRADDSDIPGAQYTSANFGFCDNTELSKIDGVRLFPDLAGRDELKYRQPGHKCPFDGRADEEVSVLGWGSGCFYKCKGHHAKPLTAAVLRPIVRDFEKERKDKS